MKRYMWKGLSEVMWSKAGYSKFTSLLTFIENKGDSTSSLHNTLQYLILPAAEKCLPMGCIRSVLLQTHYSKLSLRWRKRTNYFLLLFNSFSYFKIIILSHLVLLFILSKTVSFSVSWQVVSCSGPCWIPCQSISSASDQTRYTNQLALATTE